MSELPIESLEPWSGSLEEEVKRLTGELEEVKRMHCEAMELWKDEIELKNKAEQELLEANKRCAVLEKALKFYREKWVDVPRQGIRPAARLLEDKGEIAKKALKQSKSDEEVSKAIDDMMLTGTGALTADGLSLKHISIKQSQEEEDSNG